MDLSADQSMTDQDMVSLYRVTACLILGPRGDGSRKERRRTGGKRKGPRGQEETSIRIHFSPLGHQLQSVLYPSAPSILRMHHLEAGGFFQGLPHPTLGPREDPAHNRCSAILLTGSWGPQEGPKALIYVGRRERRMPTPSPGQVIS